MPMLEADLKFLASYL